MDQTDVLIVGAGPTGQTLALTLAHHGVRPLLVDQMPVRSDKSRAVIVQARTLETYTTLGVADQLVAEGKPGYRMRQFVRGVPKSVADFSDFAVPDTRFPFTLFVSQAATESVLDDGLRRAGIPVERPVTASAFEPAPDGVVVTLDGPTGPRKVKAKWIVGCDGARSAVRKAAGLTFEGGSYPQMFVLADVQIPGLPDDELSMFFGTLGLAVAIPLGPSGHFRVLVSGTVDANVADEPTLDEVSRLVETIGEVKLSLSNPTWISRFRLHHRGVKHFRQGRFFVAGDAAHVHSPAGGQAMNTGIQDAFNLGWKLALAVKGEADDTLLDSYEAERMPIAQQLMKSTDRVFSAMTSRSLFFRFVRLFVVPRVAPRVMASKERREKLFRFGSQLAMSYPTSPIVREHVKSVPKTLAAAPAPGSRIPNGRMGSAPDAPWLHDVLRAPRHHLVMVVNSSDAQMRANALAAAQAGCAVRGQLVAPLFIEDGPLASALGGGGFATYLVRPDGVVGFRAPSVAANEALEHLDRTLGRTRPMLPA